MSLISFWQVLVFLIAFLSLKKAKNEGELGIVHGKARLKLKYMKNPSYGELRSLCKINQYARKRNKEGIYHSRISQPFAKYSKACKLAKKEFRKPCEIDEFRNPLRNLHVIFKYFCTDSVRFLSQDILFNYLFSPCNQLKIFLDV